MNAYNLYKEWRQIANEFSDEGDSSFDCGLEYVRENFKSFVTQKGFDDSEIDFDYMLSMENDYSNDME